MAGRTRDATARTRIRDYLATHGTVADDRGGATTALREAIRYKGSSVAFIQLITAMDQAGEIRREIRGKRTYAIAAADTEVLEPTIAESVEPTPLGHVVTQAPVIDYDLLAQALLRQLARSLAADVSAGESATIPDQAEMRSELDSLRAERDEYAKRLELSRRQLNALMAVYVQEDADDVSAADGRALLAQLREDPPVPGAAGERAS